MDNNESSATSSLSFSQEDLEALRALKRHPGYNLFRDRVLLILAEEPTSKLRRTGDFYSLLQAQGALDILDKVYSSLDDLTGGGEVA